MYMCKCDSLYGLHLESTLTNILIALRTSTMNSTTAATLSGTSASNNVKSNYNILREQQKQQEP